MCLVSDFKASSAASLFYSSEGSNEPTKSKLVGTKPPVLVGDQWDEYRDANNLYRCARGIENYAVKVCQNPGKVIGGMIGLLSVPILFPFCAVGAVKHGYESLCFVAAGVIVGSVVGDVVGWGVGKGIGKLCAAPFDTASNIWEMLPTIRRKAH